MVEVEGDGQGFISNITSAWFTGIPACAPAKYQVLCEVKTPSTLEEGTCEHIIVL